jgi:hypothetical protein
MSKQFEGGNRNSLISFKDARQNTNAMMMYGNKIKAKQWYLFEGLTNFFLMNLDNCKELTTLLP